jgi:hypothetical protein
MKTWRLREITVCIAFLSFLTFVGTTTMICIEFFGPTNIRIPLNILLMTDIGIIAFGVGVPSILCFTANTIDKKKPIEQRIEDDLEGISPRLARRIARHLPEIERILNGENGSKN